MITGLSIIISEPSDVTTLLSTIGKTYVLWIGTKGTGHNMNISQKIRIHHTVNPSASTTSQIMLTTPATLPKWKLNNSVFQRKYSRFQWQRPHWTWCPKISRAATTLNVLSRYIRNTLYIFTIAEFLYILNSPVPASHLLRILQVSIRTKYHDYNYLLLRSLLVF